MVAHTDVASVAKLLADAARSRMLLRLLDGRALTASELAHHANVSPQTASSHLARLTEGGMVSVERQGRYRYYRIGGPGVAEAVEALMAIAPGSSTAASGAAGESIGELPAIQVARTCYDHLAGRLGVSIAAALTDRRWLVPENDDYRVTAAGEGGFAGQGIDLGRLRGHRRQFARRCLDWSERRHHLAGSLGAALADSLFERKWLLRTAGERTVNVTNAGHKGLREAFGVLL